MENKRTQNLIQSLPAGFEAALIQTPVNRFYYLDFDSGDAGTLVLLPGRTVFIIDARYIEIAQREITGAEVVLETDALGQVEELLRAEGVHEVYVEGGITLDEYARLTQRLPSFRLQADGSLTRAILRQRAIKDAEEVARVRHAQSITDACFTHILPFIKEGVREVDLMLEMERFMRSHGAQKVAFDTICVAGPKSSLPHGEPGDNTINNGDFITLDFGAKYKGYCSDMTRTVALGKVSEEQRKVYDLVLQAHLAGLAAAGPHKKGCEVDAVARDMIQDAGYGAYFGHGLGHSLGIEIHEDPRFSPREQGEILPGMFMTVEPGVYLPGRFGVRIEDTVLITEDGCTSIAASPKQLMEL